MKPLFKFGHLTKSIQNVEDISKNVYKQLLNYKRSQRCKLMFLGLSHNKQNHRHSLHTSISFYFSSQNTNQPNSDTQDSTQDEEDSKITEKSSNDFPRQNHNIKKSELEKQTSFSDVRLSKLYVDKTEFIKVIFNISSKAIFVCGPMRIGKTVNLDMLNSFFGIFQEQASRTVEPDNNPRKDLFKGTKIFEDETFVKDHFGQYPIIYLNMIKCKKTNYIDYQEFLFEKVRDIANNYSFLSDDPMCRSEYNKDIQELSIKNVDAYLPKLCNLLCRYYNKMPIILIDEVGVPILSARAGCKNTDDRDKIIEDYVNFLVVLLKENQTYKKAVLTGVTRLAGVGLTDLNNVTYMRLIKGELAQYYSFTEQEVSYLVDKVVEDDTKRIAVKKILKDQYNGYTMGKTTIYNCISVTGALDKLLNAPDVNLDDPLDIEDIFGSYLTRRYHLNNFEDTPVDWILYNVFKSVLNNEYESVPLVSIDSADAELAAFVGMSKYYSNVEESKDNEKTIDNKKIINANEQCVISYLYASGYVTGQFTLERPKGRFKRFAGKKCYKIKCPNNELKDFIEEKISLYKEKFINMFNEQLITLKSHFENMTKTPSSMDSKLNDICLIFGNKIIQNSNQDLTKIDLNKIRAYIDREYKLQKVVEFVLENTFEDDVEIHEDKRLITCGSKPDILFYLEQCKTFFIIELKNKLDATDALNQSQGYNKLVYKDYKDKHDIKKIVNIGINFDAINCNLDYIGTISEIGEIDEEDKEGKKEKKVEEKLLTKSNGGSAEIRDFKIIR